MKAAQTFMMLLASAIVVARVLSPSENPAALSNCFTGLGDLEGGIVGSVATDVSADGEVVVGYSNSPAGMEAFRWTRGGGMLGLGFSRALAVSSDGSTLVGFRLHSGKSEPVRWTQRAGLQGLGNLDGYEYGTATGVSDDGSAIVGFCEPRSASGELTFHWTADQKMLPLETPSGKPISANAHDVSAEGDVVVGVMQLGDDGSQAFRWTAKDGCVGLSTLPGDSSSFAHAVSADGSVVVGASVSNSGEEAFRWTQETGIVGLGSLPGGSRQSRALGVSADGSLIVGVSYSESGLEAFVWDATQGMRSLRELLRNLPDADASLRDWKLVAANAVSADGSIIVGVGLNPKGHREAWIARLGYTQFDASSISSTIQPRVLKCGPR